jgi:hypothetical protein
MALNGSSGKIIAIVLAVVLGIVVMQPVVGAVNDNTGTVTEAENVTADLGNYSDLGGYDVVDGTVVVEPAGGGTAYSEGTDYEVALDNGSIKTLSSGGISDGETLNVTYDYEATDSSTTTVLGFVPVMFGVLLFVVVSRGVMGGM